MLMNYEELASFGKQNVEAMVQSTTLTAKGVQELGKVYAAFAEANFRKATAAAQALSGVKSPNELLQVQAQLMRENTDNLVAESGKVVEIVQTVVTSALEPLQARMRAAADLYKVTA